VSMDIFFIFSTACITIFALGLLLVSIASYHRHKNLKLLFVSCVFLVFFVKGILLSLSLFNINIVDLPSNNLFDLIILILLFIATLKR